MFYIKYRLSFPSGLHLGDRSLDESLTAFRADTLFSALYQEALRQSEEAAAWLLDKVRKGEILFSDSFPYIGETEYVPKPMLRVQTDRDAGDSVQKKAFKNLAYIPSDHLTEYLDGKLDGAAEKERLGNLGLHSVKVSAAIQGHEDTEPYHVGSYRFKEGNGLYFLMASSQKENIPVFRDILDALSFTGIGGKRSAGLGRFSVAEEKTVDADAFEKEGKRYMALSICLPREEEMEFSLEGSRFQVKKRSGFVASENYSDVFRKKRDLYMFEAGACFTHKFQGDVFDVSDQGSHPVYRYGKPIFLAI